MMNKYKLLGNLLIILIFLGWTIYCIYFKSYKWIFIAIGLFFLGYLLGKFGFWCGKKSYEYESEKK